MHSAVLSLSVAEGPDSTGAMRNVAMGLERWAVAAAGPLPKLTLTAAGSTV